MNPTEFGVYRLRDFLNNGYTEIQLCAPPDAALIYMHMIGDISIFLAYMVIPVLVLRIAWPFKASFGPLVWMAIVLAAAFVWACGFGHAIHTVVLIAPWYSLEAFWKLATGFISILATVSLALVEPFLKSRFGLLAGPNHVELRRDAI